LLNSNTLKYNILVGAPKMLGGYLKGSLLRIINSQYSHLLR